MNNFYARLAEIGYHFIVTKDAGTVFTKADGVFTADDAILRN